MQMHQCLEETCCHAVQAEQQLGPGWTLMRTGTPKCPEIQDWLASSLPDGSRVGIDPFLHTVCAPAPAPANSAASACDYPPALSCPAWLGK